MYSTQLENGTLRGDGGANTLDLGAAPHDYAQASPYPIADTSKQVWKSGLTCAQLSAGVPITRRAHTPLSNIFSVCTLSPASLPPSSLLACTCLQVFVDGKLVAHTDRDHASRLELAAPAGAGNDSPTAAASTLDIVVHALGRYNFGCEWDTKGLQSPDVTLNGVVRFAFSSQKKYET